MRGDVAFFAALAESIEHVETLGNVHANSVTGSILIEDSSLSVEQTRELARSRRWFDVCAAEPPSIETVGTVLEQWREKGSRELTRFAPWAALALATIQIARGQMLPPALSLLLYAVDGTRARDAFTARAASMGA